MQESSLEKEDEKRKTKPSANWRLNREPRFEKIGSRGHEQRVKSEQARLVSQRNQIAAVANSTTKARQRAQNNQEPADTRRARNLVPAQMSLAGQRARSLNPLVYPSWWGDGQEESPKQRTTTQKHSDEQQMRRHPSQGD